MSEVKNLKEMLVGNMRQSGIFLALVAIVVFFAIMSPTFLSPINLTNIILQYSYILILSIGMIYVIVLAQIDLSVGSVVAVTGALSASLVIRYDMPWYVGLIAALALGILIGAWQGFWVAYMGIPGFIVTLAGMLMFRGLTFIILDNVSLSPFPAAYYGIANGFINGLLGGDGFDVFTVLVFALAAGGFVVAQWRTRRGRQNYNLSVEPMWLFVLRNVVVCAVVIWFGYQLSQARGLPVVLLILSVLILIYGIVGQRTVFGRSIYAIGGNRAAAQLSGINVRAVTFWTFVNMGFLAAVAGVVFSARMNGAQPSAGNMFELDAIAACFIGGASTTGGIGKLSGAIIGGLVMALMSNGMQLMGVSTSSQQVVKGLVLLLAVAFDVYNKRRGGVQ